MWLYGRYVFLLIPVAYFLAVGLTKCAINYKTSGMYFGVFNSFTSNFLFTVTFQLELYTCSGSPTQPCQIYGLKFMKNVDTQFSWRKQIQQLVSSEKWFENQLQFFASWIVILDKTKRGCPLFSWTKIRNSSIVGLQPKKILGQHREAPFESIHSKNNWR